MGRGERLEGWGVIEIGERGVTKKEGMIQLNVVKYTPIIESYVHLFIRSNFMGEGRGRLGDKWGWGWRKGYDEERVQARVQILLVFAHQTRFFYYFYVLFAIES